MAAVIARLGESDWARPFIVSIGQHAELLDRAMADFGLVADHHIAIDRNRGSILEVASQAMDRLDALLEGLDPACVIAQGDTTTVMAASLVSFYRKLPFVHVEAGLRTGDLRAPFPEEFNRRVAALGARLHCAPTQGAAQNLLAEGISDADILLSGNTVIDALLATAAQKPSASGRFSRRAAPHPGDGASPRELRFADGGGLWRPPRRRRAISRYRPLLSGPSQPRTPWHWRIGCLAGMSASF